MKHSSHAAPRKRRTIFAIALSLFVLLSALFVVIFTTDPQSSNPPFVRFISVSQAADGSRLATFEITNNSKSRIYRFGYFHIEGPALVRQIINLLPPTATIGASENELVVLPLPTNAVGALSIRFYGSRPPNPLQQVAEITGELLDILNLQPDRLKAFHDPSANTWQTESTFSAP